MQMQTALWDIDLKYSIIHAIIQCKTTLIWTKNCTHRFSGIMDFPYYLSEALLTLIWDKILVWSYVKLDLTKESNLSGDISVGICNDQAALLGYIQVK